MGTEDLAREIDLYRQNAIGVTAGHVRGKLHLWKQPKAPQIPDIFSLLFPQSVRKSVSKGDNLYIVPSGPFYRLPFEALVINPKAEKHRYLIEDHTVSYLSSASLLKILRDAKARKKHIPKYPFLAFADPAYGESSTFQPLPDSLEEARKIAEILEATEDSKPLRLN